MTVRDDVAVSIVGLGEMGSAIARAFLTSEYRPCGTDPPERAAQLMDDLIGSWKARGIAVDRLLLVQKLLEGRIAGGHAGEGFSSLIEDAE